MTSPHSTRSRSATARAGETPQRPLVVYDGACSFCRAQVRRIQRMDRRAALEYAARQTPGLADRFPLLAHGDFETGMRLVTHPAGPSGPFTEVFVGADALYEIARRLPLWRRLAWLYRVPGIHAVARRTYAWIAAHRRALGPRCEDGSCELPSSTDHAGPVPGAPR